MAGVLEETLETAEDTMRNKYLTFVVGKEEYGIEIQYVKEIVGIQEIIGAPELPDYVKGIINLRGKIIPVIDVRLRFRKEPREYNDRTCIVVVEISEISIGLIVDHVAEVLPIEEANIVPPPDSKTGFHNQYIRGIGKAGNGVKLLLNCTKLLNYEELENMAAI